MSGKNRRRARKTLSKGWVLTGYNYDLIASAYPMPEVGQTIVKEEYAAANSDGWSRNRWTEEYVVNTCGIRLSKALYEAGYGVKEQDLGNNRRTWTSNQDPKLEYIASADDMGQYFERELGKPTLSSGSHIRNTAQLDEYVNALGQWSQGKGIIYMDAKNHHAYGASGHVDLVYNRLVRGTQVPWIKGMRESLRSYVHARFGVRFVLKVWLLEGHQKKPRHTSKEVDAVVGLRRDMGADRYLLG